MIIEQLVPAGVLHHESGTLEVSSERKKNVTFLCRNVDLQTTPIVGGHSRWEKLTGYVSYDFVVQTHQGFAVPLQNVKLIEVKSSADLP
jgi:hypothetical protein